MLSYHVRKRLPRYSSIAICDFFMVAPLSIAWRRAILRCRPLAMRIARSDWIALELPLATQGIARSTATQSDRTKITYDSKCDFETYSHSEFSLQITSRRTIVAVRRFCVWAPPCLLSEGAGIRVRLSAAGPLDCEQLERLHVRGSEAKPARVPLCAIRGTASSLYRVQYTAAPWG